MIYIGIDPGMSGAIAVLGDEKPEWVKCSETEHDIAAFLMDWNPREAFACIEKVHAMPRQGVSSTFKFGTSYGFLRGLLVASSIPFREVTPAKWQGDMNCRTKGDKNITKAAAQKLWPSLKITHANADALLIAEYCRRTHV